MYSYNAKPNENLVKIKVIGIGGGGNNAVNRMIEDDIRNVEFILMNTEAGFIQRAKTKNVLQIGKLTTGGLGAGANAEVGERAAIENKEDIKRMLEDTDIVFLTAGMGGGTGTGAIPVVAQIAKEMGILTVGIVTKPFKFEGKKRLDRAELGIAKLRQNLDALIVVLNDKLLKTVGEHTSINEAFILADTILEQGVLSITDLITTVGTINIDFADIRTVMSYKGRAYMGIGISDGQDKLLEATKQAIENTLTETDINGAKGVIFNVRGGEDLSLDEINNSIKLINDKIDEDANVIFGTVIDPALDDEVEVTVIATGIEDKKLDK